MVVPGLLARAIVLGSRTFRHLLCFAILGGLYPAVCIILCLLGTIRNLEEERYQTMGMLQECRDSWSPRYILGGPGLNVRGYSLWCEINKRCRKQESAL